MRVEVRRRSKLSADYLAAIQEAIECVERLAVDASPGEKFFTRLVMSELRSLHPQAMVKRRRDRADKLESLVDQFADLIVEAAKNDILYASTRYDSPGNVIANVSFSFPATTRWLRYAARRGNRQAVSILDHIAAQRAPCNEQRDTHAASPVFHLSTRDMNDSLK